MKKLFSLVFFSMFSTGLLGQEVSLDELQNTEQTRYLAFYNQNDNFQYFLSADKYFTNGMRIEFSHPVFNNKIARTVLATNKGAYKSEYSLSLGQDMYTPENISNTEIDSTDRPYCGQLYFVYTRSSADVSGGDKIIARLFVGVQGPVAGAGEVQILIHEATGSELPKGWDNQIANGLVLDYELKQQKMLPIAARHWEISSNAVVHVGTIFNYAQAGLTAKLGWFNNSYYQYDGLFSKRSKKGTYKMEDIRWSKKKKAQFPGKKRSRTTYVNRNFQCYAYGNFNLGLLFYDGTVQGSLIPFSQSVYTLKNTDFENYYGNLTQGFTLNYRSFSLQYERVIKRDVFKGEGFYGWGQIRVLISL